MSRAKLWGIDASLIERAEQHPPNDQKPHEEAAPAKDRLARDIVREEAAKLGIDLPPLPPWAQRWMESDGSAHLPPLDVFAKMSLGARALVCEYPYLSIVQCTCCGQIGYVREYSIEHAESKCGPILLKFVRLILNDGQLGHASTEERIILCGYRKGCTPEDMRRRFALVKAEANKSMN